MNTKIPCTGHSYYISSRGWRSTKTNWMYSAGIERMYLAVRQVDSRRLWEMIWDIEKLKSKWLKAIKLGTTGARYILKHYDKLTAYLDDPRLEPTNNLRERMLRIEKLIQNGSMFRRSLEGRFVLDVIRTVLQTAVAADAPVHEYCLLGGPVNALSTSYRHERRIM